MSIQYKMEIDLPDISQILKNNMYCPICSNSLRGADPRGVIEQLSKRRFRRRIIKDHGEKAFEQFFGSIKIAAKEVENKTPLTSYLLQCKNCKHVVFVNSQKLAQFLMEKAILNEWNDELKITLKDRFLILLS